MAAMLLSASVLTGLSVGAVTAATVTPAAACTTASSGTYLGTWQGLGIEGAVEATATLSGSTFSGTITFVTGETPIIAGSPFSGTIDCSGNFTGSITLPPPNSPETFGGTVLADGTVAGTWVKGEEAGTWAAGPVFAQASDPSTTSLSTGTSTSPSDPIQAGVVSPTTGSIFIANALTSNAPAPVGYNLFDTFVEVTAPTASPSAPLQLTFLLDPSVLAANGVAGSTDLSSITVFRNGQPVRLCWALSPINPDPCEDSATWTGAAGSSDVQISVLTSQASVWGFGKKPGVAIATSSLPDATPGASYGQHSLQAIGLTSSTPPYLTTLKWKKLTPLPKGLKLSKEGVLSGTPKATLGAGKREVTVQVTETVTTVTGGKKVKGKSTAEATIPLTIT